MCRPLLCWIRRYLLHRWGNFDLFKNHCLVGKSRKNEILRSHDWFFNIKFLFLSFSVFVFLHLKLLGLESIQVLISSIRKFWLFKPKNRAINWVVSIFKNLKLSHQATTSWVLAGNPGVPPSSAYFDWTYPLVPLSMILTLLQNVVFFYLLKVIDIKHHGGKVMEAFGKK